MTVENREKVESVCLQALSRDAGAREAFLDEVCGDDAALRGEVDSLLAASTNAEGFLESPAWAPAVTPVPPGTRFGPYEIQAFVGAGGMGQVYKARDTRLDRTVAIKVLPPEAAFDPDRRRRLEREARAIAQLNHPHICTLHDIADYEGSTFLVMEYVAGETLTARLAKGQLPLDLALSVAIDLTGALAAAHRSGVIHRDVKPGNVMLTKAGAKLLDFGIAKLKVPAAQTTTLRSGVPGAPFATRQGGVSGTLPYMAPEQLEGRETDARTDIFGFGCVLHEMVTGLRAFPGDSQAAVISAIMTSQPPPVSSHRPGIPAALDRLVHRCLSKDADDRWQHAADVAEELRGISADSSPGSPGPAARPRQRRVPLLAAGAILLVFAVALAGFGLRQYLATSAAPAAPPGPGSALWTTPSQVTSAPGWERDPAISDDGSLLAYASNESGDSDIWVIPAGGGTAINVTRNAAIDEKPAWFPDSSALAFASDRSGRWDIWKVAALGGGASLLVPDARDAALSPDGRQIAFVRNDARGNPHAFVAPLNDVSRAHPVAEAETDGVVEDPAWSPDGRFICYSAYRGLWVAPAEGGRANRLTGDRQWDVEPAWAPDGRTIYFSSMRGGTYALWNVRAAGSVPDRVTLGAGPERHPTISKNGARLTFSTLREDLDLVVHDLATGTEHMTGTTRDEAAPSFSPDGRTLVYVCHSKAGGGTELWVQPLLQGQFVGGPSRLAEQPGSVSQPSFSPDGRWVVYQRVVDGKNNICAIPAGGGAPTLLVAGSTNAGEPAWSPTGDRVAFAWERDATLHVGVVPVRDGAATGLPRQLRFDGSDQQSQQSPAWSPDGRQIAYVGQSSAAAEVWLMQSDGKGAPRKLSSGAGATWVRWHPHGTGIIACGSWGERTHSLRLLDPGSGVATPFEPPVRLGDAALFEMFNISLDGRFVTFSRANRSGDVWVADSRR